ncbi:MAG: hypothetical protein H7A52_16900 [Akkermansiaceae bacterium]|nr:hypothetical protein [Akkermansiaceae bacterium]
MKAGKLKTGKRFFFRGCVGIMADVRREPFSALARRMEWKARSIEKQAGCGAGIFS